MPTPCACLDLTLPTPAENLACDEALLEAAEVGAGEEVLRFWEPQEYFVVLGYANRASQEVDLEACRARGVAVFRRCSGGGTVLQGPGCLNYSLVLQSAETGPLANVSSTNRFIMQRHAEVISALVAPASPPASSGGVPPLEATSTILADSALLNSVHRRAGTPGSPAGETPALRRVVQVQGFTDLTLGGLKFSGNAQRRRHRYLLFHGTFLLNFNLALVQELLRLPARQPAYRQNRSHQDFCTNLALSADRIKAALCTAWKVKQATEAFPESLIRQLMRDKYSQAEWNLKYL